MNVFLLKDTEEIPNNQKYYVGSAVLLGGELVGVISSVEASSTDNWTSSKDYWVAFIPENIKDKVDLHHLDWKRDCAPVKQTVATTVHDATKHLYTGEDPIQEGVSAETIEPKRAALVRGRVVDREGAPLPGV